VTTQPDNSVNDGSSGIVQYHAFILHHEEIWFVRRGGVMVRTTSTTTKDHNVVVPEHWLSQKLSCLSTCGLKAYGREIYATPKACFSSPTRT